MNRMKFILPLYLIYVNNLKIFFITCGACVHVWCFLFIPTFNNIPKIIAKSGIEDKAQFTLVKSTNNLHLPYTKHLCTNFRVEVFDNKNYTSVNF